MPKLVMVLIAVGVIGCGRATQVELTPVWADDGLELAVAFAEWESDCGAFGDCSNNRLNPHFRIHRSDLQGTLSVWSAPFTGRASNLHYMKTQGYLVFQHWIDANTWRYVRLDTAGEVLSLPGITSDGLVNRAIVPSPNGEVLAVIQQTSPVSSGYKLDYVRFLDSDDLSFLGAFQVPEFHWYTWTPANQLVLMSRNASAPATIYQPGLVETARQLALDGTITEVAAPQCERPRTTSSDISANNVHVRPDRYDSTARDPDSVDPTQLLFETELDRDVFGCQ